MANYTGYIYSTTNCFAGMSKTCGKYRWSYKERKEVING
jgi:hypothetical protein